MLLEATCLYLCTVNLDDEDLFRQVSLFCKKIRNLSFKCVLLIKVGLAHLEGTEDANARLENVLKNLPDGMETVYARDGCTVLVAGYNDFEAAYRALQSFSQSEICAEIGGITSATILPLSVDSHPQGPVSWGKKDKAVVKIGTFTDVFGEEDTIDADVYQNVKAAQQVLQKALSNDDGDEGGITAALESLAVTEMPEKESVELVETDEKYIRAFQEAGTEVWGEDFGEYKPRVAIGAPEVLIFLLERKEGEAEGESAAQTVKRLYHVLREVQAKNIWVLDASLSTTTRKGADSSGTKIDSKRTRSWMQHLNRSFEVSHTYIVRQVVTSLGPSELNNIWEANNWSEVDHPAQTNNAASLSGIVKFMLGIACVDMPKQLGSYTDWMSTAISINYWIKESGVPRIIDALRKSGKHRVSYEELYDEACPSIVKKLSPTRVPDRKRVFIEKLNALAEYRYERSEFIRYKKPAFQ